MVTVAVTEIQFSLLTTSRPERPVDQSGNNESALFSLSSVLPDSVSLHSWPPESNLSKSCWSLLSTRSQYFRSSSCPFLPLSLVSSWSPPELSLSHSLPLDYAFALHPRVTLRGTHGDGILSPLTRLPFPDTLLSRSTKYPTLNPFASGNPLISGPVPIPVIGFASNLQLSMVSAVPTSDETECC